MALLWLVDGLVNSFFHSMTVDVDKHLFDTGYFLGRCLDVHSKLECDWTKRAGRYEVDFNYARFLLFDALNKAHLSEGQACFRVDDLVDFALDLVFQFSQDDFSLSRNL